jgi:hypothetical protein
VAGSALALLLTVSFVLALVVILVHGIVGAIEAGITAAFAQPVAVGQTSPGQPAVFTSTSAVVDTGTLAGQVITWVWTTFGGVISSMLTALLYKLFKKAGVDLNQAQRDKLQQITENALAISAHEVAGAASGKGKIEVRNAVIANAVRYVQLHAADTIKALGGDPLSQATVEAIKARALAAINDPAKSTPAVLDEPAPSAPPSAAPAVAAAPTAAVSSPGAVPKPPAPAPVSGTPPKAA